MHHLKGVYRALGSDPESPRQDRDGGRADAASEPLLFSLAASTRRAPGPRAARSAPCPAIDARDELG